MRCRVYPLRRRGRRLPWRQVSNAPSFEGNLSTYYLTLKNARYFVAQLLGPSRQECEQLRAEQARRAQVIAETERALLTALQGERDLRNDIEARGFSSDALASTQIDVSGLV